MMQHIKYQQDNDNVNYMSARCGTKIKTCHVTLEQLLTQTEDQAIMGCPVMRWRNGGGAAMVAAKN